MARAGYGDLEVGAETSSVQAVHPVGTEAAPGIAFSTDTDVGLYRAGANQLGISVSGTGQVVIVDGVLQPVTTNDIDLGTADLQFKNAWFDGTLEADVITVGGVSVATGTNATTITTTANNANETVYPTFVDGTSSSQDIEVDTGLTYNPSSGLLTITGELDAGSLDISGSADIDGTMEADAYTVDGTTLAEYISDTVGGMVTGNTESGITVAYQDADNTIDFTVGTLNQNTTGSAATLTTARAIGGVSFNGSAAIDLPGVNTAGNQATSGLAATATLAASATKLATTRAIGGVNFDGTAAIDLPGVNTAGNQATSGLAATATLAAVATAATVTVNDATAENNLIPFVANAGDATGNHGLEMDTDFHYNPNTGVLTVPSITGGVTGSASQVTVTAVTDDDTVHPVFVEVTSGAGSPQVASALTYNPSTGLLTSTGFSGPITGNLTGTLQTAVQAGITTVGTIDTGVWEGTTVAVAQGGTGATTLNNLVTLGTHTTGNYAATVAKATNGGVTIANSGSESAAITVALDFDDLTAAAINVAADSIPFLDADGTASRIESIADLATAMAGTNLTASSGQLVAGAAGVGIGLVLALS